MQKIPTAEIKIKKGDLVLQFRVSQRLMRHRNLMRKYIEIAIGREPNEEEIDEIMKNAEFL